MAKLRLKRKKEVKDLTAQVENLEQALNYLKAHPEERHQAMTPFAYARRIRAKRYCALNSQINNHKRWISLCSGWAIPRGRFMSQFMLAVDEMDSIITNKAYNMSLEARPSTPKEEEVEDAVKFTIDANFENVAKTWWFDLVESSPLLSSTIVEQVQHNVVYVRHQHTRAKFKRLSLAGVFLDEEKDRITITQTGITLDEQFPFVEGENRSNGMQWIVFQHITDRLTQVRWSVMNFCPVNANGPLSLRETAQYMQYPVHPNDSEELLLLKIQSGFETILTNLHDEFRQRCSRFKLEPITLGFRDFPIKSLSHLDMDEC
ncbi:unnamed protein product [Aphanomyces euteiches]